MPFEPDCQLAADEKQGNIACHVASALAYELARQGMELLQKSPGACFYGLVKRVSRHHSGWRFTVWRSLAGVSSFILHGCRAIPLDLTLPNGTTVRQSTRRAVGEFDEQGLRLV